MWVAQLETMSQAEAGGGGRCCVCWCSGGVDVAPSAAAEPGERGAVFDELWDWVEEAGGARVGGEWEWERDDLGLGFNFGMEFGDRRRRGHGIGVSE